MGEHNFLFVAVAVSFLRGCWAGRTQTKQEVTCTQSCATIDKIAHASLSSNETGGNLEGADIARGKEKRNGRATDGQITEAAAKAAACEMLS